MEYKVVMSEFATKLETLVNDLIKDGWVPVGGICVNSQLSLYLQSLIRITKKRESIEV